jgi:hypothetical protein
MRWRRWLQNVRGVFYLAALGALAIWYAIRRAYRRGVQEGDAQRTYEDSEERVRRLSETGDVDEMREDLLEKARRK